MNQLEMWQKNANDYLKWIKIGMKLAGGMLIALKNRDILKKNLKIPKSGQMIVFRIDVVCH